MIDFLPDTPDYLVAVRTGGSIESDDINRFAERLNRALSAHEQVNLFMEITSLGSMTPEAIWEDLKLGFRQIKNLRRLHRAAVVAEQEWIRTGTDWEDRLFRKMDIRSFEPDDREEALAWASETPPDAGPPKRGLEEIPTTDPGTLAYAVTGPITGADIEAIAPRLRAASEKHRRVNLLMRMDAGYRFHLDVFSKQLAEMEIDALRHIERYAVVGAPGWIEPVAELAGPLLKLELRLFDAEDEAAAWDWLGTAPAADAPAEHLDTPEA